MLRKLKPLILLLVLATMSLRGMAAVDMWHCAHHPSDGIVVAAAGHAEHHGMHGHAAADRAAHESSVPANPADEPVSPLGAHCISSVLAPVGEVSFSFAPAGTSRIPFIELRFVGVVPAQPDRPPLVQSL